MLLNSKNEFHQAPLTRLVAVSGLQGSQGENKTAACRMAGRAATDIASSQGRGGGGAGRGRGSVAGGEEGTRDNMTAWILHLLYVLLIVYIFTFWYDNLHG